MGNSEIEIKAYVRDFDSVLNFLYKNAKFKKKYFKKDIYYARENDIKHGNIKTSDCIRLRIEHGGYTFCTKERTLIDGVEVNEEIEVKVSKKNWRRKKPLKIGIPDISEISSCIFASMA